MNVTQNLARALSFVSTFRDGVFVEFAIHAEGVRVPKLLLMSGEPTATFQYAAGLPIPIDDLEVSEFGIRATLSFGRRPCLTFIPWPAVRAMWAMEARGGTQPDRALGARVSPLPRPPERPTTPAPYSDMGTPPSATEAGPEAVNPGAKSNVIPFRRKT